MIEVTDAEKSSVANTLWHEGQHSNMHFPVIPNALTTKALVVVTALALLPLQDNIKNLSVKVLYTLYFRI